MHSELIEMAEADGNPAFDRLARIYERLGLAPEQAESAAMADLACGWTTGEFPG